MKIGITGGTGLVGKQLLSLLVSKGHQLVVFSRHAQPDSHGGQVSYSQWDPSKKQMDSAMLSDLEAIIHLAGESVATKRWTAARKKEILESRTLVTQFLVAQLNQYALQCKVFISASAIGFYGPDTLHGQAFEETAPVYDDFLGNTCKQWEDSSLQLNPAIRKVITRIGIVLSKEGGALPQFALPLHFFVKPLFAGGKQMISWISVQDLVRLFVFALEHDSCVGIINAVAPQPVAQQELMNALAVPINRNAIPVYVPAGLLQILLGAMSIEVLKSTRVSAQKIQSLGFKFQSNTIQEAIASLYA